MSINDWPAGERPREKLLQRGAPALSDAELLAIFLRTGVTGKSAVDLARELLTRFGSLTQLFAASEADFCAVHGMGQAKFVQLQAVLEMSRRALKEELQRGDAPQLAACRARLFAAIAGRAAPGSFSGAVPRYPASRDRLRGIVSRHAQPDQRVSTRSGQARAGTQCRCGHPRPFCGAPHNGRYVPRFFMCPKEASSA